MNGEPRCSVALTVGKWKSVILYYLLDGTLRFSELRRNIPGITQRMLTLQLRELEADGIVSRTVHPVVPPRVDYRLTPFGLTLEPVLRHMAEWGKRYKRRCEQTIAEREPAAATAS